MFILKGISEAFNIIINGFLGDQNTNPRRDQSRSKENTQTRQEWPFDIKHGFERPASEKVTPTRGVWLSGEEQFGRVSSPTKETVQDRRVWSYGEEAYIQPRQVPPPSSSGRLIPRQPVASGLTSSRQFPATPKISLVSQFQDVSHHICSYCERDDSKQSQDWLRHDEGVARRQNASSRKSCFPYRPDLINEWFQDILYRPASAEPPDMPVSAYVDMINLGRTTDSRRINSATSKLQKIQIDEGDEITYHATDALSAMNILKYGIDLTKSKGNQDFSNGYGFYITTDYKKAWTWGKRKAGKFGNRAGAVIAFKINRCLRTEAGQLCLDVSTRAGRRQWEKTVLHFRNGEIYHDLAENLDTIKAIRGPVNVKAIIRRPRENPIPNPKAFIQICLRNADYAKKYGSLSNICFVIFFKGSDESNDDEDY